MRKVPFYSESQQYAAKNLMTDGNDRDRSLCTVKIDALLCSSIMESSKLVRPALSDHSQNGVD